MSPFPQNASLSTKDLFGSDYFTGISPPCIVQGAISSERFTLLEVLSNVYKRLSLMEKWYCTNARCIFYFFKKIKINFHYNKWHT